MRVIAIEEHYAHPALQTPEALARLRQHPRLSQIQEKLEDLGAGRIADMDAAGVDLQVLSHTVPGAEAWEVERAVATARVDTVLTPVAELRQSVADYFQTNIFLTTSGYTTFPPLQCALSVVGIDRLIFSVDYPYTDNASARAFLDTAPISPSDREKLAHGTVERLLRL
jgi:predicted TIM-barrel fold metal-dependent hydrolase